MRSILCILLTRTQSLQMALGTRLAIGMFCLPYTPRKIRKSFEISLQRNCESLKIMNCKANPSE